MVVYRLENPRGMGPYFEGMSSYFIECGNDHQHPHPFHDFDRCPIDINRHSGWRFGFASLDDLLRWFDNVHYGLDSTDFRVNAYDVPDGAVRIGRRQVMWSIWDATFKRTLERQEIPESVARGAA